MFWKITVTKFVPLFKEAIIFHRNAKIYYEVLSIAIRIFILEHSLKLKSLFELP